MGSTNILANCVLNLLEDGLRLKGYKVKREFSHGGGIIGTGDNVIEALIEGKLYKIAVCQGDNCEHCDSPANPFIEVINEDHDVIWKEQTGQVNLEKLINALGG